MATRVSAVPSPPGAPSPASRIISPWPVLTTKQHLTIVKWAPDGSEVTRYPGRVAAERVPPGWLAIEARWVNRAVHLDGLDFLPGDTMIEYFSPVARYNAFAVHAPDGTHRGWYANVTHPATLDLTTDPPTLVWHDLYLDLVVLPDRTIVVRDHDELAESGLERSDPDTHARILAAEADLLRLARAGEFPFWRG